MRLNTTSSISLRENPLHTSKALITVPAGGEINITGKKYIYDGKIPFIRAIYNGHVGYINARYVRGLVLKISKTDNSKYPKKIIVSNGTSSGLVIKDPQQKKFNSFCKSHGCSMAAVTVAAQLHGIFKSPSEVWAYAKAHLGGYTGSKLTIYGTAKVINLYAGKAIATWKPITGNNNTEVVKDIQSAVKKGYFVLVEQKNPIHTNVIVGRAANGKVVIATNGTTKQTTIKKLVSGALHGEKSKDKQRNWFKGSKHGAGYVIVKNK